MNKKILIIGFVWPEPQSSAAGKRMLQLISMITDHKWEVIFASTASDSVFMQDIESPSVERKAIVLNSSDFDVFVAELNPSIVIFDRFMTEEQFGWRVAKHCPDALRILDLEDLHCLRRSRQKALKDNRIFDGGDLLEEADAKREIASILRCDLSLVISKYEMKLLRDTFRIEAELLYYLPLFSEIPVIENLPGFATRKDFVFLGNFLHEPNTDTVKYLRETVWPAIRRKLPEAQLHIYGAYPPESVMQWHKPTAGFSVHGRAENAETIVKNARVVLAPIRFGAGIKGKLLEAMQCGTPSITTSIGAEAMYDNLPWNGLISDNPEIMADFALQLYRNDALWVEMQQNGFNIIGRLFLRTSFEPDFIARILSLQQNLELQRKNNFIGSMLQFHTMRSTEYLSRWIEEKNKKD